VQVPPSGPDEPALQVQLVTAELPAGDVALVGHALHERADDSLEYLPAEQGIHAVEPGLEVSEINLGCEESQLPVDAVRNAGYKLTVSASGSRASVTAGPFPHQFAPGEKVPAGQALQVELVAALTAAENVPAGHSVQLLPGGPHEPALQLQFVTAVLPRGDVALVGHACLSLAAPAQ
jgi:hypothetical protein